MLQYFLSKNLAHYNVDKYFLWIFNRHMYKSSPSIWQGLTQILPLFVGPGSMQISVYIKRINFAGHIQVITINVCKCCTELIIVKVVLFST